MTAADHAKALKTASAAAAEVGALMRKNLRLPKRVNEAQQHDIKLELDVRSQQLIEKRLRAAFSGVAVLGEEGITGDIESSQRWVVDPIDGTVNFTYGIPHACVSIAFQTREPEAPGQASPAFRTRVGVVYDPFTDEMFTATSQGAAKLNGRPIHVSERTRLQEAVVSIGFAKSKASLEIMLPQFNRLVHKVRKIRIMGAAALAMVYVAAGRFDAYVEGGVRLWDIAAGGLILERAGGDFFHQPVSEDHVYRIIANNGRLRRKLQALARPSSD